MSLHDHLYLNNFIENIHNWNMFGITVKIKLFQ